MYFIIHTVPRARARSTVRTRSYVPLASTAWPPSPLSAKQDRLDPSDRVPLEALHYLTAECNYGGRVTDDNDRRLLRVLLERYYSKEVASERGHRFSEAYAVPEDVSYCPVLDHIQGRKGEDNVHLGESICMSPVCAPHCKLYYLTQSLHAEISSEVESAFFLS